MTEPKRGIDLSTAVIAGADGPAPAAPTYEELEQLALKHAAIAIRNINGDRAAWVSDEIEFARAVLERWGGKQQPDPVAGEESLMAAVIAKAGHYNPYFTDTIARAAILAVADWLHAFPDESGSCRFAASRLRREVGP